ncbi:hypothetical protein [Prosthecobacter sp.]|uniref:hypothetical protein n=1 Tax=Prosthecobacter sp. TaxID=1965333 RepID=UPI002AB91DAC|nr:hypothetical protein [Prosthecobacter sp.]MDZ4405734.1 hypothetical protein [Prosthecobacter sp.]
MKFGFFLLVVVGALVFAVQVLKRLPSDRFTEAAAVVSAEDQIENEAREFLRKRLGPQVKLAPSSREVMNDGTLIVTQDVLYENSANARWLFRYSPPPYKLLLVTTDGRTVFEGR